MTAKVISRFCVTINCVVIKFQPIILKLVSNLSFKKVLERRDPPTKLPSYRDQSTDLLCKSTDWFLYDGNFGV